MLHGLFMHAKYCSMLVYSFLVYVDSSDHVTLFAYSEAGKIHYERIPVLLAS